MRLSPNILAVSLKSLISVLSKSELGIYKRLTSFLIFSVMLDALSLLLLLPVLNMITSHELVKLHRVWGKVYQYFNFHEQEHFLLMMIFLVFISFLVKNIVALYVTRTFARFSHRVGGRISLNNFFYYINRDYLFHKNSEKADLITQIMFVPSAYASGILLPLAVFISESILLLILITGIAFFKPLLFLLLLSTLTPVLFLSYRALKKQMHRIGQERNSNSTASYNQLLESFNIVSELKLNNKQAWMGEKYKNFQATVNSHDAALYTYSSIPSRMIELTAIASIGIILFFGVFFQLGDSKTLYLISIFAAASFRMIPSLNRVTNSLLKLKNYQYTIDVLCSIPAADAFRQDSESRIVPKNNISFNDINFKFEDGTDFLYQSISIDVNRGQLLGISGKSGEGKSTLLYILSGLITPQNMHVFVDGKQLNASTQNFLSDIVSLAQQEVVILNGTLTENIALNSDLNESEVAHVNELIELCCLEKVASDMHDYLLNKTGEHGVKLSGGQKQRIGLARALYKKPTLLLIDEATSWLDSATEQKVIHNILDYCRKSETAVICISHSEEVLELLDHIYILENGNLYKK